MKKILAFTLCALMFLSACKDSNKKEEYPVSIDDNYKNYYEIYVGGFYDSDGDGVGDLKGITEKLSYLNDGDPKTTDDLGVTGIWLMPIMPSPSYHKYDVTDYYAIDPQYGTMEDFDELVSLCNERGIDLILDLVLNHTSTQCSWFQSARKSLGIEPCGLEECPFEEKCREHNPYCDYYNFSQTKGANMYSVPGASGWYYEAVFWDQMPDLNLDSPAVREEVLNMSKFWLDKGVKGFRLDAIIHYFGENKTKNIEFLKWYTTELQKLYPDVYLVGEAWTGQNIIKDMYASDIPSIFNYGFSNSTGTFITSVKGQKGKDLATQIQTWQEQIKEENPNAIDATFLTNHDNARSAGALNRDLALEKMGAAVYLLAPGNSFTYYGEEIGMTGSGKDENKRQPLVWSVTDETGIPKPVSGSTNTDKPEAGIDEQLKDKDSLLSFYRDTLRLKDLNPEIARGTVTAIDVGNDAVCAYKCEYDGSQVYVIHNLSKESVDIKLSKDVFSDVEMRGNLKANGGTIELKDNELKMPSLSTVILK